MGGGAKWKRLSDPRDVTKPAGARRSPAPPPRPPRPRSSSRRRAANHEAGGAPERAGWAGRGAAGGGRQGGGAEWARTRAPGAAPGFVEGASDGPRGRRLLIGKERLLPAVPGSYSPVQPRAASMESSTRAER